MIYVAYFVIALALSVDAFAAFLSYACLEEKKEKFLCLCTTANWYITYCFPYYKLLHYEVFSN